jgi:hypothetical protein
MKKVEILKILNETHSMSKPEDIYVESKILNNKLFDDCSIIEFGAGLGGWPLSLHYLGVKNKKWTLVDNLTWFKEDKNFIINLNEKIQVLNNSEFIELEINDIIKTKDILKNKVFDVIRIDCNINENIIDFIVNNCISKTAVIFIDDIIPSWGFTRVYLMFYLIMKYKFHLIWIGTNQCLLSKNEETKNTIIDALVEILSKENNDFVFLHRMSEQFSMLSESENIKYISTTGFFLRKD